MNIIFIIFCLVVLIIIHELGHFLVAKKFDVKVEEFGVGLPPRAFGKKIGETIYSLNWIPLGGFVKLLGEDEKVDDKRSFSSKPIYQRALIVVAGVFAFFVMAFFIFTANAMVGLREVVTEENIDMVSDENLFVFSVFENSLAEKSGLKAGDRLLKIDDKDITDYKDEKFFTGKETSKIIIDRRGEEKEITIPLLEKEEGDFLGMSVYQTGERKYSFFPAIIKGATMTGKMTYSVVYGFFLLFKSLLTSASVPQGMEVGGPVAIVGFGVDAFSRGLSDFLYFLGAITISLAVLNILPLPALDGGRLMFLAVEKIKGSPIPEKVEYGLNALFFVLLLGLMLLVTFKDLGL